MSDRLSEADVLRLISRAEGARDAALVRTLYGGGLRPSEAANLRKCDVSAHRGFGVLTVFHRRRSRAVRISAATLASLVRILPDNAADRVFPIGVRQIGRLVKAAALRAGLPASTSPRSLLQAHDAHALERGCPIGVLQRTRGLRSVQTIRPGTHARPGDSPALYLPV